jgi:hypothetical protein
MLMTPSDGTSLTIWTPSGFGATIATLVANTWFFWAVVANGSGAGAVTGYYAARGANTLASQSQTGANFTPDRMQLGNDQYSEFFNGRIERVCVWDAVLTPAQLLNQMKRTIPIQTTNINIWSPMVGTTAANAALDKSGNGRNWTATGTIDIENSAPVPWGAEPIIVHSGSGTQSYTATVDGGMILAGLPTRSKLANFIPNGGVVLAGVAAHSKRANFIPIGGMVFAGNNIATWLRQVAADGGIIFGGAGQENERIVNAIATGGIIFEGDAVTVWDPNAQIYTATPDGGVLFAGDAANLEQIAIHAVDGGIIFGGEVVGVFVPAGGGPVQIKTIRLRSGWKKHTVFLH